MASTDEKLDVLNEAGEEEKVVKDRLEVHKDGDWHRSVHVWIVNSKGELLIQKRSKDNRVSPGFWTISASGHVESGVSPIETAIQELREEIGVSLREEDLEYLTTYKKSKHYKERGIIDNEFNPIFVVEKDIEIGEIDIDEREVVDAKYIHWMDLRDLISSGEIDFKPDREKYHSILFDFFSE